MSIISDFHQWVEKHVAKIVIINFILLLAIIIVFATMHCCSYCCNHCKNQMTAAKQIANGSTKLVSANSAKQSDYIDNFKIDYNLKTKLMKIYFEVKQLTRPKFLFLDKQNQMIGIYEVGNRKPGKDSVIVNYNIYPSQIKYVQVIIMDTLSMKIATGLN